MNFGEAIAAAKTGYKVARTGWNGQNMYVYIVPGQNFPAVTEIARQEFGSMVPYRTYWALKTAQGDVATWAPSGSDSLAEDWFVVEDKTERVDYGTTADCATSSLTKNPAQESVKPKYPPGIVVLVDRSKLSYYNDEEIREIFKAVQVIDLR